MSQVETVALWAGLITGIISIALSVVAIRFTEKVDTRSSAVSDQTIKTLQKIETTVEHLTSETQSLIKMAWEKMFGASGLPPAMPVATDAKAADMAVKEVAAGLASELRSALGLGTEKGSKALIAPEDQPQIKKLIRSLEESLSAQLRLSRHGRPSPRPSDAVDYVRSALGEISVTAQALARALLGNHLTTEEYHRLQKSLIGHALAELREAGVLVPLRHEEHEKSGETVYYFPPGFGDALYVARPLLPDIPAEIQERVRRELVSVGYRNQRLSNPRRSPDSAP